jgi:polyisoprenoid-binding protein YceI
MFTTTARDPWGNLRLGYEASAGIERQNFGISFENALEAEL